VTTATNQTKSKMKPDDFIRPDLLFSYWIYLWFFIYYVFHENLPDNIRKYGNPALIFWIALLENIATFVLLLAKKTDPSILAKYIIMIAILKGVPLYLLRNYKIYFWWNLLRIGILFFLYNVYLLWANHTDALDIYKKTFKYVQSGDVRTPLFAFFAFLERRFALNHIPT